MAKAIPKGLTRDHVLLALADLDAGTEHSFGQAIGYELVHKGRRYSPKAVIGLAFKHKDGRILGPMDFRGGQAPGQANAVLRDLGFEIVEINGNENGFITSRGYALRPPHQMKVRLGSTGQFRTEKATIASDSVFSCRKSYAVNATRC